MVLEEASAERQTWELVAVERGQKEGILPYPHVRDEDGVNDTGYRIVVTHANVEGCLRDVIVHGHDVHA